MNLEGRKKDEWNGMFHDPKETHFAVNKETNLIVNGWDYSDVDGDTLRQFKKDYFIDDLVDWGFNPKEYKILGRSACIRQGINPDDITCWSNNGYDRCGQDEQESVINEVKFDYDENPLGLPSRNPKKDIYTFEQLAADKQWNINPGQKVEQKIIDLLMKYSHPKVYRRGVFQPSKPSYRNGMEEYYMTFDNDPSGYWVFRGWCPAEHHGPMRRMNEELSNRRRYKREQLTMNESSDQWEDAVYRHETRERLPKGWDKHEREDDEPIYTDPDYQEYVKDEYGKFVPYIKEEAETTIDDKNFVLHARTGSFAVNVVEEIEYDEYTACLNCYINRTIPATIYVEKSAYDRMKNGGQYCDCICKIARSIKDNGEEIEGTLSKMNMNETLSFDNDIQELNENNNEMWDTIIEYGMGSEIEDMVYDFCEKHDMENIDNLIADEVKNAVFQVFQNHIRTMEFLNRGWEFK